MYWLQLGQLTCFIIAHISLFGLVTKTVTSWLKKAKMVCKVTTISSRFPVYLSHPQICERIYILKTCRISLCHSQKSEITTEQHVQREIQKFNGKKASVAFTAMRLISHKSGEKLCLHKIQSKKILKNTEIQFIYIIDTTVFSMSNTVDLLEDQQHNQIQVCFIRLP